MSKLNQKIVLFIEPAHYAFEKPSKIGNLFINRFAIDEDAQNEILKIYKLERNLWPLDFLKTNSLRSVKETRFLDTIDSGVASMVDFGKNDMMPHFIYCYGHYIYFEEKLKMLILKKMREYGIPSSILTILKMNRINLITKEKSKEAAEGKLKNDPDWEDYDGSINDDLDLYVKNLQNSGKNDYEEVWSFFTPKLTNEELKLVAQKNEEHMGTYLLKLDADVGAEEMKKSDSKDKYVHTRCIRRTEYLYLESEQSSSEDISSDDLSEDLSEDIL